ncbi:peptide chain release factor N(5)-glutamine methyltransferase [Sphingobacterium rhinopitheci]|uniref:peptide chain release factor N(5)-glutamine methyltransferase n=1 Tax=Sphingobacterium rhinopitheci TaxID=2781960 RepID=UPI001F5222A5|nr:peptide chain release factor N(5)-glutamine methyltransferase [Sphingobacterium rhinopitheci]MCI0919778.1 peptide chain release factor N(5)-glutamine methyltransferase [Sphingobacterium rhinopitheci]
MTKTWTQVASDFQHELADLYPKGEIHQLFLIIFEHITAKKNINYALMAQNNVGDNDIIKIQTILDELKSNKPVQHIIAEAYFYGNVFEVSEHTLIPRPETEELVDLIIKDNKGKRDLHIIDIGTGSGCIPISLALNLPGQYTAVEISPDTMKVAKRNDLKHQTKVQFIEADILEWDLIFPAEAQFDIIVSNPPYITPKEKSEMSPNVLQFEPHLALFVEDDAPLLFYDYIADFALAHLAKNGTLYFEINQYLGKETVDLLHKKGFGKVEIIQDINGADRIIRAK